MNKKERKEYLRSLPDRTMTEEEWLYHDREPFDVDKEIEELKKDTESVEESLNEISESSNEKTKKFISNIDDVFDHLLKSIDSLTDKK